MIGTIGILLGIALIIYLSIRGYNIVLGALISSVVVIVLNQMDFFDSIVGAENSFMVGLTGYLLNFFMVFLLGSILAKYMELSGAATSIAEKILSVVGTDKPYNVLLAIFLISAVLSYGGISVFVVLFVLIPLARPIFKRLDLAWNLVQIPVFAGIATFTMTMLPGSPAVQNVVPSGYLGTPLTAAPLIGLVSSAGAIIFSLIYMKVKLNKSLAKNETYATYVTEVELDTPEEVKELPKFGTSIIPIIVLIVIILGGSILEVDQVILIALIISILLSALLFNNYIPSQKETLNAGTLGSISPAINTSSAVAFGTVVTSAPAFVGISNFLFSIPGPATVSLSITAATLSLATGSASGALGIVMESLGETYLAMGLHPELMHRVAVIASAITTSVPHSGVVLTFLGLTGLNHKNGYIYQLVVIAGANLIGLVIAILLGALIY